MIVKTKRKKLLFVASLLFVLFAGMQFIPVQYNQSSAQLPADFIAQYQVPDEVKVYLYAGCYDCHSNNTRYPWYGRLQPFAWFVERHIADGKAKLNFSEWNGYSARRKRSKLKSIISQIREGQMPPASYTWIHNEAIISRAEQESVLKWLQQLEDTL